MKTGLKALSTFSESAREMKQEEVNEAAKLARESGVSFIDAKYLLKWLGDVDKCKSLIIDARIRGVSIYSLI